MIKAAPTPAAVEAKPVIATRGTPAVSHNDADTSAAAAQAAATELCVQALKGLGKLKSDKQQEAVAACKEAALSPSGPAPMAITYNSSLDNCVDGTKTLCASPDVWRIARRGFTVTTSSPLTIKTNGNTRLDAMSGTYNDAFMIRADFRFDGLLPGQTSEVLFKSGAFVLTMTSSVGGNQLQASVGGSTALTFTGLERGRWYRIVWGASKNGANGHFLHVRPWDFTNGGYLAATTASDCVYQTWTASLSAPGTVYIGHDGTTSTTVYFHGRVDNVALLNYHYSNRPAACTQQ